MSLEELLKRSLEEEEVSTVSNAFGGAKASGNTKSYSVARIRDLLIYNAQDHNCEFAEIIKRCQAILPAKLFRSSIGNLIRFSFLIELTNLTVGSTKMKTRWLPGLILMPQDGSFEPIQGSFEPGNDPRSSSFEDCLAVFVNCIRILLEKVSSDQSLVTKLEQLSATTSFPYEFVFDYVDTALFPIHVKSNVSWVFNEDIEWLLSARPIIWPCLTKQQKDKIQTKTYKTDRALTGKDKTNRAKRWEVLSADFQHASLTQCWSVERKLLGELVGFEGFPQDTKQLLIQNGVQTEFAISRCPVTLEPLQFSVLLNPAVHGRSDYQVGHLHPLKKGGRHDGENVCWQSCDGNRIQGDLMIEEIVELLDKIMQRKIELGGSHIAIVNQEVAKDG